MFPKVSSGGLNLPGPCIEYEIDARSIGVDEGHAAGRLYALVSGEKVTAARLDCGYNVNCVWQTMRRMLTKVGCLNQYISGDGPQVHDSTPNQEIEIEISLDRKGERFLARDWREQFSKSEFARDGQAWPFAKPDQ